jgi:hypothetical protein
MWFVRRPLVPFAVLGLALLVTPGASAARRSVTTVDSLVTVKPHGSPHGSPRAHISAARNEFESFQIVVFAGRHALKRVKVSLASPPSGPAGRIAARHVTIYRERYLDIRRRSDLEGGRGRWPDALVPEIDPFYREHRTAFPVNVPPGENRVAWVDVRIPRGQAAGEYSGRLRVRAKGGFARKVPFHVDVHGFTIPSTPTLKSAFGMGNQVCAAHFGRRCDERKSWALKSLYARAALEDRISISDPAFGRPSSTSLFRRYVLPLLRGASPRHPKVSRVRLRGARLTSVRVEGGGHLGAWKKAAKRDGFQSRAFLIACDEPERSAAAWDRCKAAAREARRRWPGLSTLVTATIQEANQFSAAGLIDIMVPIVNRMDDKSGAYAGNQRAKYNSYLEGGILGGPANRLWLYTSCLSHGCVGDSRGSYWAGWPSYVIDQPASEHRAMGFLAYEYGAPGELYYNTDHELKTAWRNQYVFSGNGEGTLFYPGTPRKVGGKHDIPIESIRLKRIRDGREDYEYLHILSARGQGPAAMGVARGLFPNMYSTDVPAGALKRARSQLADMIGG